MSPKERLFRLLRASGALRAIAASDWRRERLVILCYHGLSLLDEHEWDPLLYMTPARFRARLALLRDGGYHVLPLTEAMTRLADGTLPPRSVAITFDDGTVDFAEHAVPALREFGVPATVYLTTFYAQHRLPVFDTALRYVLWCGRDTGPLALPGIDAPLSLADADARARAALAVTAHSRAEGMNAEAKDELIAEVARRLRVDYDAVRARGLFRIMSPAQVGALPPELVDVQLHTHRHRTPRDHALFAREIRDNGAVISALAAAPRPLEHFCYPSGEYFGEFLDWLPELGVRYATTCVPDVVTRRSHPLLLPRFVDTTAQSDATFEAWTSGAAALLPRRKQYRLDPERLARPTPAAGTPAAGIAG